QLQERNVEPFHEDVGRVRAETDAADVHQVAGAGEEPYELALVEAGGGDDEVVEVPGAEPGVVGDVGVAGLHVLEPEMLDEMLHRLGHGVDVAGGACHGLRQHAAFPIEYTRGQIAGLAHHGGERGPEERLRLLLDDGDQAVPHDLQLDVAGQSLRHAWTSEFFTVSISALPASTAASKLAET